MLCDRQALALVKEECLRALLLGLRRLALVSLELFKPTMEGELAWGYLKLF